MAKTTTFLLVLVAVLALVSGETTTLRRGDHNTPLAVVAEENSMIEDVPSDRRQLWSWFSLLFLLGPHVDCDHPRPPGPLGHKWDHDCSSSGSDSDSYNSTSSSSATYYDAETETYVTSNESVEDGDQSSTNSDQDAAGNSSNWWPLAVAGLAASVAVAAVIVGQRSGAVNPHPMQGSVARRRGLFENFADRALCDQSSPSVELVNSKDNYRLA